MKKLLSVLLATVLLLTGIPLTAVNVSAETSGDFAYTVSDGVATITGYTGSTSKLIIPSKLGGYPVTRIGWSAFDGCTSLTSVTIGDSVTSIGDNAFLRCTSLTSVTIGDSVTRIGGSAFSGCTSLTSIAIPDSVTSIGDYAFEYCTSLTTVTIPDSVTSIGMQAFFNCTSLTSVTIGDSVTSIGMQAFENCTSLTSVTIPDSVTYIGHAAFAGCKLTSMTIPDSVTSIGVEAFSPCASLTAIKVDENNAKYCSVDGVLFNKDKTTLIQYPARKTATTYAIPDSVTSIGDYAVRGCYSLTSVAIPDSVTSIGWGAFEGCISLSSVTIPDSVTIIDNDAFFWCDSLADVYYAGTKAQAQAIKIDSSNEELLNATWHYNSCIGKAKHDYTNACDKSCNRCNAIRTIKHDYKAATCTKAKTCKVCGATSGSKLGHSYKKVVTKATTTANGKIKNVCTRCDYTASKVTTIYKVSKISLSKTSYTYDGKVKKPTLTVKDSKGNTISKSNYTVTYATGRKNVGKYKVTIKMRDNYSGTKTLYFKINPAKTTLSSLTAGSKKLTVKWARKTTQVTGYQIQYSTSKSFKSYKIKNVTSYKKTSLTLTGLKAKTTYYVRVRTYKTVNGKKVYSGWSTIKYKKTK